MKEYLKIEKEIYNRLGSNEEAFKLLWDLSEAAGSITGIEVDAVCIQVLQDGFSLVEILKKGITWPINRDPYDKEEMENV